MTTIILKKPCFMTNIGEHSKIDEYINDFLGLLPDGVDFNVENLSDLLSPRFILNEISSALSGESGSIVSFFATLLVAVLLSYVSSIFDKGALSLPAEKNISFTSASAICLVALFPVFRQIFALTEAVGESLSQISRFFASLIPLLTSIAASGGAVEGAAVSAVQMSALASVIEVLCSELFMPLLFALLSLGAISTLGGVASERLILAVKNLLTKGLGLVSLFVSALFTMQSLIASAKDTMSLRLARFTAQSIAPSIGAVISASMSTLASGISYARGIVGVGAIFAIMSMVLSPALPLVIYRFAVEFCQNFAALFGVKVVDRSLNSIKCALDGIISVFFISVALLVLQLVLFLKVGTSTL